VNPVLFRLLLRRHGWLCAFCAVPPLGLGTVMGIIYPLFEKERQTFAPFFGFVRRFFSDFPDFMTPAGAFVWPFMHPMTLLSLAIAPAIPVLALPAGDRGTGTLDLLLATPLRRGSLIITLGTFLIPVSALIALAAYAGSLIGASVAGVIDQVDPGAYALVALNAWLLSMCLGFLGLLVSTLSPHRGTATWVLVALLLLFFIVDVLGSLWRGAAWIGSLGPLGYYDPVALIARPPGTLAFDAAVLVVSIGALWGLALWVQINRRRA
jgi:ABC-type transport system involved in multi-copper enzyme maturation permease subunit